MSHSRYQSVPTHPCNTDDSCQEVDEGPLKWPDRICRSCPLVTFFALMLVAVSLAITLSLSLSKTPGIFIENTIYSATCIENLCLFGFSDYPRDIPCTEDRHCATFYDPCASNPCSAEGTEKCVRGPKGGHACICKERYGGPLCENKIHPCDYENPCFGQATCVKHPVDRERFSCSCQLGWMGTRCEYRSQDGDTCTTSGHCNNRGQCLKRSSRRTCHCSFGYHGVHCRHTVDMDDCLVRPCKEGGQCINHQDGYNCFCKFGRAGKQCHNVIDFVDCSNHCLNGGRCDSDLTGSPVCRCQKGYGGDFCTVRDVSKYRRYKGGTICKSQSKGWLQFRSLLGRWFLMALKNNTYNPPDACVQLSFVDEAKDLKNVRPRNGSLAIRYMAKRNDTSSHHKIEKVTIDETRSIVYPLVGDVGENGIGGGGGGAGEAANGTVGLMITGRLVRLYAFPLTNLATHDEQTIDFGVVYSSENFLVLHSCIQDKTHGHFDSLLVLGREKDDTVKLAIVLQEVYKELPYVAGNMVMVERDEDCKD